MVSLLHMTNWKIFLSSCHFQTSKSWLHHLTASSLFMIFTYIQINIIRMCDLFSNYITLIANMVSMFCWDNCQKYETGCNHSLSLAAITALSKRKAYCRLPFIIKLLKNKKEKSLMGYFMHFIENVFFLLKRLKLNELLLSLFLPEICQTIHF